MNDINEMPPVCAYCPYWEVCKPPYICPDIGDKKPKRTEKRTATHASDLISRAAAIDALVKDCKASDEGMLNMYDIVCDLKDVSSAQPETAERTTETAQNVSDEDLISRKAAIDAVCESVCEGGLCRFLCPEVNALKDLPSAQPERQKGEWIDYSEDGYVECPFCHNATNCDGNKDELHFCFSCGADMRRGAIGRKAGENE